MQPFAFASSLALQAPDASRAALHDMGGLAVANCVSVLQAV